MDLNERFDAVCFWDTIEHLPQPAETLERAAQVLRPGGYLFATTGDFGSLLARLQGLRWRQIHPPTHLFYFTRRSLRALCDRLGLSEVSFHTVTVHRRLGSALEALAQFHRRTFSGRLASVVSRLIPPRILDWSIPLNLGDTLFLAARKPPAPSDNYGLARR
jgi:SAM-dependent methyltransferase